MAVITGTLFLKSHLEADNINTGTLVLGLIFFSIVNMMFTSYAEQTLMIMSLHVYFKQRAAQFFPAWAFALPTTILRIPGGVLSSVVWSVLVYWLTGLAPDASRYMPLSVICFSSNYYSFLVARMTDCSNQQQWYYSVVLVHAATHYPVNQQDKQTSVCTQGFLTISQLFSTSCPVGFSSIWGT